MKKLRSFLAERLPLSGLARLLQEPVPENVGWCHTFGSALLFLLLLQVLTGLLLLLYYAPTPDHAWESVKYLTESLPAVGFVRSLHVWSATLIVIVVTLHIVRVTVHGAYKRPRELNWVAGFGAFLLIFGFLFTGYLLPWDQKGYWGTRVGLEMIQKTPLAGGVMRELLQGGSEIGAYTLNRFLVLHVMVLPALLLGLVAVHLLLLRYHKIAPHPQLERPTGKFFPFYPRQVFRDLVVSSGLLVVLGLVSRLIPAVLEAVADPTDTTYDPRPEWYFLAHYELLRLFTWTDLLPIFVIPTLLIAGLLALPFLDRSPHRYWKHRKLPVFLVCGFFGLLYLTAVYSRINHPAGGVQATAEQLPLPDDGDPAQMQRAREVFVEQNCVNCHRLQGTGGLQGPDLSQAGWKFNARHLRSQILNPQTRNPDSKMPAFEGKISDSDLDAVVEYLSRMQ